MCQPRLEPVALLRIVKVLLEPEAQLLPYRRWIFLLGDPQAHAHHLRERPVRDTLAVREAAAAMPPDVEHEPVDVLLELPRQPGLAYAGHADDRDEARLLLVGCRVEEV